MMNVWVEKYRPVAFDDIILEAANRRFFENVVANQHFPNLLFYGPPGTGKTTTIINLINSYQTQHHGRRRKINVLHLNASDERGIDIVRNQIFQFVKTQGLFEEGLKFVILDEVDYMTKNAQQALKSLLQLADLTSNVRYCLVCNYISKIDEGLQNEFITIRFNQLPRDEIFALLRSIADKEGMTGVSDETLRAVQDTFRSDVRSMINFLQLNQQSQAAQPQAAAPPQQIILLDERVHDDLLGRFRSGAHAQASLEEHLDGVVDYYNQDIKTIVMAFFDHVLRRHMDSLGTGLDRWVEIFQILLDNKDLQPATLRTAFVVKMLSFFKTD